MSRSTNRGDAQLAFVLLLMVAVIFWLGFLLAETQTTNACRNYGKFSSMGSLYECKKVEEKK